VCASDGMPERDSIRQTHSSARNYVGRSSLTLVYTATCTVET